MRSFRFLSFAAAAATAIAIAAPVAAADQPVRGPYTYQQQPVHVFNWGGPYAGFHGLYGWNSQNTSYDTGVGVIASDFRSDGFGGGLSMGYNWQFNRVVFGLEMSGNWDNIKGAGSNDFSLFGGLVPGNISANGSVDWSIMIGPRIGIAMGNRNQVLPYVGAGWAYSKVSVAGDISVFGVPVGNFNGSDKLNGWYVEAGIDWRISPTWSAKLAYIYADRGTLDFTAQTILGNVPLSTHIETQAVKIGLTAHFATGG